MGSDTVLVTGSDGTIGGAAVAELAGAGYRVVSFDREPGRTAGASRHWTGDLLDRETVDAAFDAVAPDAVVHLGTLRNQLGRPAHETYRSNAMTTYNVLEAARDHAVSRVAVASSSTVVGGGFQEAPVAVESLPVDESHPLAPRDPYALGKRTIEVQAAGFARRTGAPRAVATFRFPWVAGRAELRERLVDADRTLDGLADGAYATRDDLFAYLALEDAARALGRGIEADIAGHETFFVTAADTTTETPSATLAAECYADATVGDLAGHESLVDCEKARRVLDWEPTVSWRDLAERDRENVAAEWRAARRQSRERADLRTLVR